MHQSHLNKNFYTYEELRDFTNNFTDLNLTNLTKFVEVKTKNQYTIVSGQFIKDTNKLFLDYDLLIFKFSKLTNDFWEEQGGDNNKTVTKQVIAKFAKINNDIWEELKDYNKNLTSRHEELLSKFELKGGK